MGNYKFHIYLPAAALLLYGLGLSAQPPSVTISGTDVSCYGMCDGEATASVAGGTPPYAFLWNKGETSQTITGLCPDAYSVTVTDSMALTGTNTVTIAEPPQLIATAGNIVHNSCNPGPYGSCNGGAEVFVIGGTPSYFWRLTNDMVQPPHPYTSLCPGSYTVTVTDSKNCSDTATFRIEEDTAKVMFVTLMVSPDTTGGCDGGMQANVYRGTPGYAFSWCNGSTRNETSGLCSSQICCVTVTDMQGCEATNCDTVPLVTAAPVFLPAASRLAVYPNPTNGTLMLSLEGDGEVSVVLLDLSGRLVKDLGVLHVYDRVINVLDLSATPPGAYMLRVTSAERTSIHKVLRY